MSIWDFRRTSGTSPRIPVSRCHRVAVCLVSLTSGVLSLSAGRSLTAASASAAKVPSVTARIVGAPESVFDTRNSCELIDIPDAFPRAYRDFRNTVHLIATHYVARAMTGPSLNELHHDCKVIYSSPHDPDPAHFHDEDWITSLYTEDGWRIAALMHSEYQGDQHPGMCGDTAHPIPQDCAWIAVTYAESRDGGRSFREPTPPKNLVASLPYVYDKYNKGGAQGYNSPTNILKLGNYYYSMVNVRRQYKAQGYGPCLIRTATLFDPSSWRGFDGKDFNIEFIDPYVDRGADPDKHVCYPIVPGTIDSLAIDQKTRNILGLAYVEDNRYGRGSGLYAMASRDLIHWSSPSLVASTKEILAGDQRGNFSYLYFALLDPDSKDRNFITVSATPYVYYVRLDNDHGPYERVLFRRRIRIEVAQ